MVTSLRIKFYSEEVIPLEQQAQSPLFQIRVLPLLREMHDDIRLIYVRIADNYPVATRVLGQSTIVLRDIPGVTTLKVIDHVPPASAPAWKSVEQLSFFSGHFSVFFQMSNAAAAKFIALYPDDANHLFGDDYLDLVHEEKQFLAEILSDGSRILSFGHDGDPVALVSAG